MSKVSALASGLHVSVTTLAAEFGVTRETAARRIADAGVKPSGKRAGYPVYRLKDVWGAVLGQTSEDGTQDPDKLDPFKRQAHYKAEHLKLQVESEQRELIPRIEVEQEQARILRVVALFLDTLPDILERDCGLAAAMIVAVEKRLDQMREELHKALTEDEEEAAA
jgi:hypothetical protein